MLPSPSPDMHLVFHLLSSLQNGADSSLLPNCSQKKDVILGFLLLNVGSSRRRCLKVENTFSLRYLDR